MIEWEHHRALVTGGNRGIGGAVVKELSRRGAEVVFSYWGDGAGAAAEELAAVLGREGGKVHAFPLDLADEGLAASSLAAARERFGPCRLIVNNARIDPFRRPATMSDGEWWALNFTVNVTGSLLASRAHWPDMVREGFGRIVNISSIHGFVASPEVLLPYGATKAALLNLTRSLARKGADAGITVNTLAPGMVDTGMLRQRLSDEEYREGVSRVPLGRPATEEEIAEAVAFLLGAGFMTGTTLHINGGEYMN